jgi:hypothetical protein
LLGKRAALRHSRSPMLWRRVRAMVAVRVSLYIMVFTSLVVDIAAEFRRGPRVRRRSIRAPGRPNPPTKYSILISVVSERSVRQECLDHLLILHEKQLQRVLNGYVAYFNGARPHQGIQQQVPEPRGSSGSSHYAGEKVMAVPILAGLHHDYQRVA